jgi:hypothetical protein
MPADARVQVGSPDLHLTIVDRDGISGLNKPNYEYDFYQVQPDIIPNGGSIAVTAEGSLDLNSIGQSEAIGGVLGNTNAAGFGNLAGRIRIEELTGGNINHALTIAVPCTNNNYIWPADHSQTNPPKAAKFQPASMPTSDGLNATNMWSLRVTRPSGTAFGSSDWA